MNFGVDIAYTVDNADGELDHMKLGIDHVKVMEAMGGVGRKVGSGISEKDVVDCQDSF